MAFSALWFLCISGKAQQGYCLLKVVENDFWNDRACMHAFAEFAPLSLSPLSVSMGTVDMLLWVHPDMAGIPSRGKREYSQMLHATESVINCWDAMLRSSASRTGSVFCQIAFFLRMLSALLWSTFIACCCKVAQKGGFKFVPRNSAI